MALTRGKVVLVAVAFVVGGVVGAALYAWLKGDVERKTHVEPFSLPDAAGPTELRGMTADDITSLLSERGFACSDSEPQVGEDSRTFRRCALERADKRAVFAVTLVGSTDKIVAITTQVLNDGVTQHRVVPTWAEIATSFDYDGAAPARARRWLLTAYETGGNVAVGDAYLKAENSGDDLRLELRARGDRQPPTPKTTMRELARRFAPVIRLNSSEADPEPYDPISIRSFIGASRLTTFRVRSAFGADQITDPTPIRDARLRAPPPPCPRDHSCYVTLDLGDWENGVNLGPANTAGYARLQARLNPAPTVYWHAVRDDRAGITIQYWFLYLFNDFGANQHESDWEHVSVYVDSNEIPLAALYSSHEGGTAKHWASLIDGLNRIGERLVVYVARGSHANYFGSGAHQAEVCRAGFCGHGLDLVGTELRELRSRDYALVGLTGRPFTVGFGTGNYIIRGRLRIDSRPFPDPRTRPVFRRPRHEFESALELR